MGILERIKEIEQEMDKTQRNKATEGHLGMLKARLAKLRSELLTPSSGGGGGQVSQSLGGYPNRLRLVRLWCTSLLKWTDSGKCNLTFKASGFGMMCGSLRGATTCRVLNCCLSLLWWCACVLRTTTRQMFAPTAAVMRCVGNRV